MSNEYYEYEKPPSRRLVGKKDYESIYSFLIDLLKFKSRYSYHPIGGIQIPYLRIKILLYKY